MKKIYTINSILECFPVGASRHPAVVSRYAFGDFYGENRHPD
jgi:hypothetical protein